MPNVIVTREDPIAVVQLDRPDVLNALSEELMDELVGAARSLNERAEQRGRDGREEVRRGLLGGAAGEVVEEGEREGGRAEHPRRRPEELAELRDEGRRGLEERFRVQRLDRGRRRHRAIDVGPWGIAMACLESGPVFENDSQEWEQRTGPNFKRKVGGAMATQLGGR